jgi:ABC-type hemin transport system substrate-binding protein
MDPVANLKEQRELARELQIATAGISVGESAEHIVDATARLAELVLALDEWRQRGGYDPYTAAA